MITPLHVEAVAASLLPQAVKAVHLHLDGAPSTAYASTAPEVNIVADTLESTFVLLLDESSDEVAVLRAMGEDASDVFIRDLVKLARRLVLSVRLPSRDVTYSGPIPRGMKLAPSGNLVPDPLFGRTLESLRR